MELQYSERVRKNHHVHSAIQQCQLSIIDAFNDLATLKLRFELDEARQRVRAEIGDVGKTTAVDFHPDEFASPPAVARRIKLAWEAMFQPGPAYEI